MSMRFDDTIGGPGLVMLLKQALALTLLPQ